MTDRQVRAVRVSARASVLVACLALVALATCARAQPGTDRFGTSGGERTIEESVGPGAHFVVFRAEPLARAYQVVVFSAARTDRRTPTRPCSRTGPRTA